MIYLILCMFITSPLSANTKKDVSVLKETVEYQFDALGGMAQQMYYMQIQIEQQARQINELELEISKLHDSYNGKSKDSKD